MRIVYLLAPVVMVAGLTFACGGSSSGTSEDALKERVKESAEAIFQGKSRDAYNFYSERCREDVPRSEFAASLGLARAFFEGFTGIDMEDLEVEEVKVRDFKDGSAQAAIVVRSKNGDDDVGEFFGDDDEYSRWEVEDGAWVNVDCSEMSMGSSDDDDDDDDNDIPVTDATARPTQGNAADRTPTAPASATRPKVGESATVEGARYTVREVRDNVEGDEFSGPEAGKRWVAADVTIEAIEDVTYGSYDFTLQDGDLFVYESEFVFADEPSPRLSSGELGPGDAVRGWVFFEVPEGAVLREIRVSPGFGSRAVVIADLTKQ